MLSITRIFKFEAAHSLSDYDGPCRNIHGHSYKVHITVSGNHLENGMLLDFKVLKKLTEKAFVDEFDHALLLKNNEQNRAFSKNLLSKIVWLNQEPTAEFLVQEMRRRLNPLLPAHALLTHIRLYETELCYVDLDCSVPVSHHALNDSQQNA